MYGESEIARREDKTLAGTYGVVQDRTLIQQCLQEEGLCTGSDTFGDLRSTVGPGGLFGGADRADTAGDAPVNQACLMMARWERAETPLRA